MPAFTVLAPSFSPSIPIKQYDDDSFGQWLGTDFMNFNAHVCPTVPCELHSGINQ